MTDEQDQIEELDPLVKTSVSMPRYLFDWVVNTAKSPEFNSRSAVMVVALAELKGRMDERKEREERGEKEAPKEVAKEAPQEVTKEYMKGSENNYADLLLQLLNIHQELVKEANDLRKKQLGAEGNHNRVTFE